MTKSMSTTERTAVKTADAAGNAAGAAAEAVEETVERGRDRAARAADAAGETVSEFATRARRTVEEGYREAADRAGTAYDRAAEGVEEGYRQARAGAATAAHEIDRQARYARSEVSRFVDEHPLMVGVIGFAGGLLIGALLPRGRRHDHGRSGWRRSPDDRAGDWYAYDDSDDTHIHRGEDIESRSSAPRGHGGGSGRVTDH